MIRRLCGTVVRLQKIMLLAAVRRSTPWRSLRMKAHNNANLETADAMFVTP
jgi:hypothetical protein